MVNRFHFVSCLFSVLVISPIFTRFQYPLKVIPANFLSMSSYSCKSCSFSTSLLNAFTTHAKVHRNVANYLFACGVPECLCTFKNFQSFKSHMYRHHGKGRTVPTQSISSQPENVILSCQVEDCKFQSTVFSSLCAHLKCHIKNGKRWPVL